MEAAGEFAGGWLFDIPAYYGGEEASTAVIFTTDDVHPRDDVAYDDGLYGSVGPASDGP
jgi:hypothetical protein